MLIVNLDVLQKELGILLLEHSLPIKKGLLAVVAMYVCQLIAGTIVSVTLNADRTLSLEMLGVMSALLAGCLILLLFWWDTKKSGLSVNNILNTDKPDFDYKSTVSLILILLVVTHALAYLYRSIILPEFGFADVQGGGSKVFDYVYQNEGVVAMVGFLSLALIIGPIMEEVVFRGYLQRSLSNRFPVWIAISIASTIFMFGHHPMVLWPMYFVFSFAWGWIYARSGRLSMAILFHVLNNLFYTIIGFSGLNILA